MRRGSAKPDAPADELLNVDSNFNVEYNSGPSRCGRAERRGNMVRDGNSVSRDKDCGKALFQWLVPNPLEAFQHPYDQDVSLSSISFGTLVQLGVFVQHKLFSSSIVDDHCTSTRRSIMTSACCMSICTSTIARAAQGRSQSTGSSPHT
ncbi:hypothetical protein MRX96_002410 [Rhipicephalus microplus]